MVVRDRFGPRWLISREDQPRLQCGIFRTTPGEPLSSLVSVALLLALGWCCTLDILGGPKLINWWGRCSDFAGPVRTSPREIKRCWPKRSRNHCRTGLVNRGSILRIQLLVQLLRVATQFLFQPRPDLVENLPVIALGIDRH